MQSLCSSSIILTLNRIQTKKSLKR